MREHRKRDQAWVESESAQAETSKNDMSRSDQLSKRTLHRLPVENLKRCPLCGVLNAAQNAECFVCRWHGLFDRDPSHIEACLFDLLERCPELADAMAEATIPPPRPSLLGSLKAWFVRLVSRAGLDMRV